MLIFHVTSTDPAGSVYNMIRAINQYTPHRARLYTSHKISTYQFPGDIDFLMDMGEEIEALLTKADVIHLHKVDDDFEIEITGPKSGKRKVYRVGDFFNIGTKKKVVYHVHGQTDERAKVQETGEWYKSKNAKVLTSTPDLEEMYKPFCEAQFFPNLVPVRHPLYLPRETDALIEGLNPTIKKYCIVQTPTDALLKDCQLIRDVVEDLAKTYPVFLHEVSGVTHKISLLAKRSSHIVFDHVQGYYGLSSLEGLSMGKPVVAGLSSHTQLAIKKFFNIDGVDPLPWVVARTHEDLVKEIGDLLKNPGYRKTIGDRSRKFMEVIWSDEAIAKRLVEFYATL